MDGQNSVVSVVGPIATNAASLRLVTQALLRQKPWLHDPLVHEIPWRTEHEDEIKVRAQSGKLVFGVLRTDGEVNPMPPVTRAVEEVVKALQAAGHEVIDWTPPSHKLINDTGFNSWIYDGGKDVRGAFALSGEPMADQISFYASLDREFTGSEIAAVNVKLRQLKKEYLQYWNSTSEKSKSGQAVDAVISPLAPFPAARPKRYSYYGYSTYVNALDLTSVVVPVTNVEKGLDKVVDGYEALNAADGRIQGDCKCACAC